jgi:hypothetical protein
VTIDLLKFSWTDENFAVFAQIKVFLSCLLWRKCCYMIYLFVQRVFVECRWCVTHFSKHWG